MVAGPTSPDPYEALAKRITDLESALQEQGRRSTPDREVVLLPLFDSTVHREGIQISYMHARNVDFTSERTGWEGRIAELVHPRIFIDGVWGCAVGSQTSTITYRLKFESTTIGTWVRSNIGPMPTAEGPFDVSSYIHTKGLRVFITATVTGTIGTDTFAFWPLSCRLTRD
jgi:hypothetical protein